MHRGGTGPEGRKQVNLVASFGNFVREGREISRYPSFPSLSLFPILVSFFPSLSLFIFFFSDSFCLFSFFFFSFFFFISPCHPPWWLHHGRRRHNMILFFFSSYSFILFGCSSGSPLMHLCFFFLLPTPVRPQCLFSFRRHHFPLSRDNFAPVGPSSVSLRALSLLFFFFHFISLFLFAPPWNLRFRHASITLVAVSYC